MKKIFKIIGVLLGTILLGSTVFAAGINTSIGAQQYMTKTGINIVPIVTTYEFGSTTRRWTKGWFTDLDVSGIFTFGGVMATNLHIPDDLYGTYGNTAAAPDARLGWNTAQTTDALFLGTSGSRNIVIADSANAGFDFAHGNSTDSNLFLHSRNQSTTQWLGLTHNATDGIISTGAGDLLLTLAGGNLAPSANGGASLGISAGNTFANLYLASGGVIDFGGGDVVIANASNQLSIGGALIHNINQAAATSGNFTGLTFAGGAHTGLTLSTEATDINFNLARTVQFATGALATQRAFRVQAPTYDFVAASNLTTAVTMEIGGAPAEGANATISNAIALRIASNATTAANTYGLHVTAPTGGTTANYAAFFSGAKDSSVTPSAGGIIIADTNAVATGVGGVLVFQGVYTGTTLTNAAAIQAAKTNATDGNYNFDLVFNTRDNGGNNTEKMRIASTVLSTPQFIQPNTTGIAPVLRGSEVDGAAAVGVYIDTVNTFVTAGSRIVVFRTGANARSSIGSDGTYIGAGVNSINATNSSVTLQNQTFTAGAAHNAVSISPTWVAENFNHVALNIIATQNGANTEIVSGIQVQGVKATAATTLASLRAIDILSATVTGTVTNNTGIYIRSQTSGTSNWGLYSDNNNLTWNFAANNQWFLPAPAHTLANVVNLDFDVNSASVNGIGIDGEVSTALSAGEIMNGIAIDVDGNATDAATSQINGLSLTSAGTTSISGAGTNMGIRMNGYWDTSILIARSVNFTGIDTETSFDINIVPSFTLTEPAAGQYNLFGTNIDLSGISVTAGAGTSTLAALRLVANADADVGTNYALFVDSGTSRFDGNIQMDIGAGTSQLTIDGSTGGCIMLRDTDDAGWSEIDSLDGVLSVSIDADGICD